MGLPSIRVDAMTPGVDRFCRSLNWGLIIRLCLASLCLILFSSGSDGAVRYLETLSDLQMVTIDNRRGSVYAAGTNVVYRFDLFLGQVLNASKTGPERGQCKQLTGECSNEARILERIPNSESLLFCGSGRYGLCAVIDMQSMNVTELDSSNRLSYSGGKESVCGFFSQSLANGPLKLAVLYVAGSYDGRPPNVSSSSASSISALLLEKRRGPSFSLRYHFTDGLTKSALEIGPNLRSNYDVRYIYGFEHKGFTYFLTVQREYLASESLYETKLARVCQQDSGFFSYTEISLACRKIGMSPPFYNIALSAHMSTPGWELGQKLRLSPDEKVLYVIFGQSVPNHSSAVPANGSALCLYNMSDVRKEFTAAQVACYRGSGRLLPWINPNEPPCKMNMDLAKAINDSFCGNAANMGIRARYPFQTDANFTTRDFLATSLRTVAVLNKTVALIGTTSGHLLKVVIDGTDGADPYDVIDVGAGSAIRNDMELDEEEENVYVLSGKKISMVPLKSCSVYGDCSSCIMTKDPMNCGWCEDHCSTKSECLTGWLSGHCPPVIHSFLPRTGPVEGGTVVTIHGENFGNGTWAGSTANVKVANNFECHIEFRNSSCILCKTKPSHEPLEREFRVLVMDASKTTVGFEIRGSSNSGPYSFSYKVASIKRITPAFGPVSGGTNLTITGGNLDIGSHLAVSVVGRRCIVTSLSSSEILCYTSPLVPAESGQLQLSGFVEVMIDNAALTRGHYKYSYCEDPVISNVFPNRSILSGGMSLTVTGKNLDCVSRPRLYVNLLHEEKKYDDACLAESGGEVIICKSPDLINASSSKRVSVDHILPVEIRFAMDGVREVWNFPDSQPNLSQLGYTVDPEVFHHPENESMEPLVSSHLVLKLQGRNLNLSAGLTDYNVLVGGQVCNLTRLTIHELECWLEQPISMHQRDIVVRVGRLVFYPGQIRLFEESRVYDRFVNLWMPVMLAFVLGSTVVVIICVICLRCLRRGPFRRKFQTVPNVLYSGGSQVDVGANRVTQTAIWLNPVSNSYLSHSEAIQHRLTHVNSHSSSREPILDEESRRLLNDSHLLINRDRLVLLDIIGQGHFGCVYRGFLQVEAKDEAEVAVKTLKSRTECIYMSPTESRKFLDEALTMREFDHVHVLKLIGIVIDKEEFPLVVLPFMKHGDLLSYIRCADNSPTVKNLMEFAMQVADGMNYLANLKFVHRDLAARNCMLDDDMLVKVADFGLSRDIYESDYYSSDDRKAKLPVKWMALESLEKGIYSTRTDVWSFGVVLWELMTRGICPYPEVDNWDIIKYIKSGRRMLQPSYCPDSLYKIMLHCWNPDHTQRPTFEELVDWIRSIIAKMEGAQQHAVSLNVEYINTDFQSPQGYLCPLDSRHPPEGNVLQKIPEWFEDAQHPTGFNTKYMNSNDVHGHGYLNPVDSRYPEGAAAACEGYTPDYLSVVSSCGTLV